MSFQCLVRCNVYEIENDGKYASYKEDIELTLNMDQAAKILFRFEDYHIMIGDFKLRMYTDKNKNTTLTYSLFKRDEMGKVYEYLITNTNQFISNVHEGYFRLLAMNKFSSILEFNFENELDPDEVEDEFES